MHLRSIIRRPAPQPRPQPPPRPTYLFVVAYGRSGSTLVQGLLNSLPGVLVRGENQFFVLSLFQAWQRVSDFHRVHTENSLRGPQSAFYGIDQMRPADFIASARRLTVKQLYGATDRSAVSVLGFKEVLWHEIEPDATGDFFTYFERLFPDARYVVNRRDHAQVATSGFWLQREPEAVAHALQRTEEIQDFLTETRPDRTHPTRYETLTSPDPAVVDQALRALAGFALGRCDDDVLASMRETLATGHGPRPFGRSRVTAPASDSSG